MEKLQPDVNNIFGVLRNKFPVFQWFFRFYMQVWIVTKSSQNLWFSKIISNFLEMGVLCPLLKFVQNLNLLDIRFWWSFVWYIFIWSLVENYYKIKSAHKSRRPSPTSEMLESLYIIRFWWNFVWNIFVWLLVEKCHQLGPPLYR